MAAILFGSISSVADTSELQRDAFNRAFAAHGLDWHWDRDGYRAELGRAGGRDRIARYARERGEDVDADAVHATKSRLFQESLPGAGLSARPGVVDVLRTARSGGERTGLVTTTSADNVAALLDALAPDVRAEDFDVVVDATEVTTPKPDPAVYTYALRALGESAGTCVAVEDNPDGVRAAAAAGIACVAFPNENTVVQDFPDAAERVDHVDIDALRRLVSRG